MTRLLLVFGLLVTLTGCEGLAQAIVDASANGTDTAPRTSRTTQLAATFTGIEAIKDCDGIEGYGDFNFRVSAQSSFSSSSSGEVHRSSPQLTDGQRTGGLGRRVYEGPAVDGQTLSITFTASEVDQPVIGSAYNDTRLNNTSRTAIHTYRNGRWDKVGSRYITLGGGDCSVRLHYDLDQLS
ncbi:MAG: hypothetical protein AAFQ43_01920 [Bacteroidota bacterium]